MTQLDSEIDLDDSSEGQRNDSELVDLISSLPDSILGYILSFRPTKEAVRTSVLSKRWKLAWVTVRNIDFCYVGSWKEHDEDANKKFIRFVIRVLLLNDVGSINKFSLVWHPWCNSSLCRSWTNTAISRNVCHLSLSGQFDLPVSVFSCDSLQSLELKGRIYVPDMVAVCLPRLEALELDGVDFHSEEAFEKLISGCSLLDNMCLNIASNHGDDFTYIISSASLRRFELCFKHKCSLKLKASSLEYIEVFGCIIETFEHENLRSLLGAYFSIHLLRDEVVLHDNICKSIVEAFDTFYQGKDLNFLADAVRPLTSFHPSRVSNMLRRQSLRPDNIERYHLCEADPSREMVDQIYDIFQLLPPKIQVCLFTATITEDASLEDITREFDTIDVLSDGMIKKLMIGVKKKKLYELTLEGTDQFYVKVENENQKLQKLSRLFVSVADSKRVVVFVNTRRKVDWLTNKMRGRGRTIYAIHGDMDRKTRDIIVGKFHSSSNDVLITTNLFAGGFSVLEVSLVVNYDVPTQPEKYLHRGGRFERKKGGMTITFTTRAEEMKIVDIQKFYGIELKYLMAF